MGQGLAAVDTTVLDAYFFLVRRLRPGAEIFSILFQVTSRGDFQQETEQWKNPGCLGLYRGWQTTQLNGEYILLNHFQDPHWVNLQKS